MRNEDSETPNGSPSYNKDTEEATPQPIPTIEQPIFGLHDRGDLKGAVGAALALYGTEVFAFLRGALDAQSAEDANMDVWEAVLLGIGRFQWKSSFRTWVYTIARRTSIRYREERRREKKRTALSDAPELLALEAKVRTDTAPFMQSEVRVQIARIRESLAPEDRMLLSLHVDQRMPWIDVARIMFDIPDPDRKAIARVRKRYQRIKAHILEQARKLGLADQIKE